MATTSGINAFQPQQAGPFAANPFNEAVMRALLASQPGAQAAAQPGGQPAAPADAKATPGLPTFGGLGAHWTGSPAPAPNAFANLFQTPGPKRTELPGAPGVPTLAGMPSAPAPTAADNLYPQSMGKADWEKSGAAPPERQPVDAKAPGFWKRALFGLSAGLAGINHPEITASMVERYNDNIDRQLEEARQYNQNLPQLNAQATDQAYQRYLAEEQAKAGIANDSSEIAGRLAQAANQKSDLASKTVTTDQGVMQFDPATNSYKLLGENKSALPVIATAQGYFVVDAAKGQATPLTFQGRPLTPPAKLPTPTDLDTFTQQYLADHHLPATADNMLKAREAWTAAGQAPVRPSDQEKAISDYLAANNLTDTAANRTSARNALTAATASARNEATANEKSAELAKGAQAALKNMNALIGQDTPAANYAFMMNFIGMAYSGVRGARLNQAEIDRAGATRTLPDQLQHWYDLAIDRKQLTPQQKRDMLHTAEAVAGSYGNAEGGAARPAGVPANWVLMNGGGQQHWVAPGDVAAAKKRGATEVGH